MEQQLGDKEGINITDDLQSKMDLHAPGGHIVCIR